MRASKQCTASFSELFLLYAQLYPLRFKAYYMGKEDECSMEAAEARKEASSVLLPVLTLALVPHTAALPAIQGRLHTKGRRMLYGSY